MQISRYILLAFLGFGIWTCSDSKPNYKQMVAEVLRDSVLILAKEYATEIPQTVTSQTSERSAGGLHDFYSEGDYWWPDPDNPEGSYIRRDGMTNPANFTAHRDALLRFSQLVGNLTSAYILTKDTTYAKVAITHCKAWFIDENTRMNPHLLYAQAIKGRHTGRGIGIIDAIHFMEVVQSLIVLEQYGLIPQEDMQLFRKWFSEFVSWLTTHPYGKDEMVHPNNHGTCWNMQVGLYAVFTKNDSILSFCRNNFKNKLLPGQMDTNGSFPRELKRTKPYGYSLFNLDAMAMNAVVLGNKEHNLWEYVVKEGKSLLQGLEYMRPYVADKSQWPLDPDVMYWENWPVAHPSYLFGAIAYDRPDYFELWEGRAHFHTVYEVIRNMPIRNPLIWLETVDSNK